MDNIQIKFTQDVYELSADEYMRLFSLLNEARDTIQPLTMAQLKHHNLNIDFADRLDAELEYIRERA